MNKLFENKVVLVTGAGSGIGRAAALGFAREGAKVIVVDVNENGGNETVAMIKTENGEAVFLKTDISNESEVIDMIHKVVQLYGHLDCAFNNAAIPGKLGKTTIDYDSADWDRLININLKGTWLCMKHEIIQMLAQGHGAIVNTSSDAGLIALPGLNPAYIAAKHGIVGITKLAAIEFADKNIRINAIAPGMTRTGMTKDLIEGAPSEKEVAGYLPIKRVADPAEIAEAAIWLASDKASFVTGSILSVDGGSVAD
ncbi:MAG TPA: short chain dehydrogenase [Bacteroidales bacterium]|nr:short chain dehydrogenase [Bacteroidales bacterium]